MSALPPTNAEPTQAQFLEHGLEVCSPSEYGLENSTCSICTEDLEHGDAEIVKLILCEQCYFHKKCIVAWFTSTYRRRGICPNDRTMLFQPDGVPSTIAMAIR
jgi:hypothetical protein